MQVMALVRCVDSFPEAAFNEWAGREQHRVSTLYMESSLRQIWLRDDVAGACLLFEVDSIDTARALTESLPMLEQGMLTLEALVPLKPYVGFAPR